MSPDGLDVMITEDATEHMPRFTYRDKIAPSPVDPPAAFHLSGGLPLAGSHLHCRSFAGRHSGGPRQRDGLAPPY